MGYARFEELIAAKEQDGMSGQSMQQLRSILGLSARITSVLGWTH